MLVHVFPDADVPVVQLSIDGTSRRAFTTNWRKRLAPLRDEGVLIVGSGNVVHNLGRIQWADRREAVRLGDALQRQRARFCSPAHDRIAHRLRRRWARMRALSVPTPEHYLPLLYVIALQSGHEGISLPIDGIEYGSIGMLTAVVGLEAD